MKGTYKKSAQFMLVLVVAMSMLLAACSNNNNGNSGNTNTGNTNNGGNNGGSKAAQEFRFTLGSEPPSLDPATMKDAQSGIVAQGLYEGLTRLDSSGEPQAAIAKDWDISEDGKTYTFHLRDDVKWSNGDPVVAADFVYSWQRTLMPETAADYAYMLYYMNNAEGINSGDISDTSQLGAKAIDEHTLEVTLTKPAPYFLSLLAHYSYLPVDPAVVDGKPDWAADAKTIVSNGPFLLDKWEHGSKLVLVKNPDYYDADNINFTTVTMSLVEDNNTVYNMFETDKIDWIGAQAGSLPADLTKKLVDEGKAEITPVASVYYYLFNTQKAPFDNANIRKAFAMAVERQNLIDNVTQANQQPAYGLVPPSIAGVEGKSFRDMYPDTDYFKEDMTEAKALLAKGMEEDGLTALPEITLLYNTDDNHKKIAEAIADMWRRNLGVEVKLANQEWGTFLETRKAGSFDVARSGWGADFNHPINFTYDLIYSKSGNNDGKYNNPEVDKLLDDSLLTTDIAEGMDKIAQAEKIAFADDMGALPLYYYTTVTLKKDNVEGVVSDYAGTLDWVHGSIK
ncbi:peptide ABC transporter substrate-binding protein [Paenibacillus sp. HB172176]|uniref:peptide ABC transporter substrate-binding protein n=1 Tax=Paenibacillus sp. HB172176 TaxID=2493690 RepID=UPI00143BCB4C|nr:peptide ABC transporter substrate-binding protein [Paenibacillus sp. HB172176]